MTAAAAFILKNWQTIALIGAVLAFLVERKIHGDARYDAGVTDTTAAFVAADKEGAQTVHETARETLRSIDPNADLDQLLRDLGGLRDE